MDVETLFLPVHRMANLAGVPEQWLRDEAKAGRIPSLVIGRRVLFNPALVQRALLTLAEKPTRQEAVHAG